MKNEGLRTLTREEKLDLGQKLLGKEVWSDREMCGKVRRRVLSREIKEKWEKCHAYPIYRNPNFSMDWELSRIKKVRNSYRGAIERYPQQKGLDGSRSYRTSKNFLDRSSSCREAIEIESQESRWIEITITAIEKGSSKGSINSLAIERYQEAVEIA